MYVCAVPVRMNDACMVRMYMNVCKVYIYVRTYMKACMYGTCMNACMYGTCMNACTVHVSQDDNVYNICTYNV